MTLGELARRCGGELFGADPGIGFGVLALDSRHIEHGDVFVAIQGARVDGHQFANVAVQSGAVCSMVTRPVDGPYLLVPDIAQAIAAFGSSLRNEFEGIVVGITGSNGKTSAKEFLRVALTPGGSVMGTLGNLNTEYSSPLLWEDFEIWGDDIWAVVVEMSMRGVGQIAHLCGVHRPTHGLITNIGTAHIELLGSKEKIADAKGELLEALPETGIAVLWAEDPFLERLKSKTKAQVRTYGTSESADARLLDYRALSLVETEILVSIGGKTLKAALPTVGRHQAINATGALMMATALGVDPSEAAESLSFAQLPPMRMEHRLHKGADILMDNYNASPDSMKAALRTLMELPCKGNRIAVIGEMRELGKHAEEAHKELGGALVLEEPDMILLYGPHTRATAEVLFEAGYPAPNLCLATSLDDVRAFLDRVQPGDLVLVKGSRALGMEEALAP